MGKLSNLFKKGHGRDSSTSSARSDEAGAEGPATSGSSTAARTSSSVARSGEVPPRVELNLDHDDRSPVVDIAAPSTPSSPRRASPPSSSAAASSFQPPQHSPPAVPAKDILDGHTRPQAKGASMGAGPGGRGHAVVIDGAPSLSSPRRDHHAARTSLDGQGPRQLDPSRVEVPPRRSSVIAADGSAPVFSSSSASSSDQYTILPPPTSIAPPPTSSTDFNGVKSTAPSHPSFLSTTESLFSSTPVSPTSHLQHHEALRSSTVSYPPVSLPTSTTSLTDQRLALLEKIRSSHQPAKGTLDSDFLDLFKRAGLEVKDSEGKGTVEWTESWLEPVVQERVQPVELREYSTILEREVHKYHIHPKLLPLVSPHPSIADPSLELHYFRDASGAWREVVGRHRAQAILAACAKDGQVDEPLRWTDDRAVQGGLRALGGVVHEDNLGGQAGQGAGVKGEVKKQNVGVAV